MPRHRAWKLQDTPRLVGGLTPGEPPHSVIRPKGNVDTAPYIWPL